MLRWCTDCLGHCERLLRESSSRIAISEDNVFCDVSCARNCRRARRIFKAYRTVTCIVTVSFRKGLFLIIFYALAQRRIYIILSDVNMNARQNYYRTPLYRISTFF